METTAHPVPDRPARFTFTVEEVARLLRVSRSSAYEAVRTAEIPVLRVGRRILVPAAWVAARLGVPVEALWSAA